jgi:hypothetical protein
MTDETSEAVEAVSEDTTLDSQTEGEATEDTGDDAAAETTAEAPKPKPTAQERIAELTRLRREAERDAEYWKSRATQPEARPEPKQQAQAQDDGEPNPDDYEYGENDRAFIEDRAAYKAVKAVEERMARQAAQQSVRQKLTTFDAKTDELFPDGEPNGLKAFKANPRLNIGAQELIMESEIGPKLADHLGSNPRELARISALPPFKQARELTLLEQRLSATAAATPTKVPTSAPEPPPTLRGAGGKFKASPDTDDFAAFEKAYGG